MGCVMMSVEGCIDADDTHVVKIMCRNNCAPYHDFDDYIFSHVLLFNIIHYSRCPLHFSGTVPKFQTHQFQRLLIVTPRRTITNVRREYKNNVSCGSRRSFVMMTVFCANEYYIPTCQSM